MKKRHLFLFVLTTLLLMGNVKGQEYSAFLGTYVGGSWSGLKNQYSIIREIDSTSRMVFTYYQGLMTFSLYDDGSPNVINYETWGTYPTSYIYDFEILGDTVYYCGQRNGNALVGKFCYTSAPSVTFQEYISNLALQLLKFDRLDVYKNNGEIRLVLVGSYHDGVSCIAEVKNNGPTLYIAKPVDTREVFDDVAVTDGYIVTASRLPVCSTGYYRLFKKPMVGTDMFTYNLVNTNVPHAIDFQVNDKLILEHCEGDYFAVAVRSSDGSGTLIGAYDPLGYSAKVKVFSNDDEYTPVDIKYDRWIQQLHLLQRSRYNESHVSHINSTMASGFGLVMGHHYSDYNLFSIDRVSASAGMVIATGRPNMSSYPPITWVYKLNAAMWGSCTEKKEMKYEQPKDFNPCILETGLNFFLIISDYEGKDDITIDYYKTMFCE